MHPLPQFFVLRAGEPDPEAPSVGAKVHVVGRPGQYVVLRVDKHRRMVDLLGCDGLRAVDESVPFADIRKDQAADGEVTLVRARIPRSKGAPGPSDA